MSNDTTEPTRIRCASTASRRPDRALLGLLLSLLLLAAPACYGTDTLICESGLRCAPNMVCIDQQNRCVTPEEAEPARACVGKDELAWCSYGDVEQGICREQSCVASSCGNGFVDPEEVCDDGNTIPGDGCSSDCQLLCGNGQLDEGEVCDTVAPPGETCLDFRFDLGSLGCADSCQNAATDKCQSFSWVPIDAPITWQITDIWAHSTTDIYVVGFKAETIDEAFTCAYRFECGFIAHYDGFTWQEIELDYEIPPIGGIWGTPNGELHAVGFVGHTFHYDGSKWNISIGDFDVHLLRVWGLDESHIYAVGIRHLGLFDERNIVPAIMYFDGEGWQPAALQESDYSKQINYLAGITGTSPSNLFASGHDGMLFHYDGNRDRYWTYQGDVDPSDEHHLNSIAADPHGNVIAVGESGHAFLHRDGAWQKMDTGSKFQVFRVVYAGNHSWFASNEHGEILSFDGNPENKWSSEDTGAGSELIAIAALDENIVLTAGVHGTFLLRQGSNWKQVALPGPARTTKKFYADSEGCLYAAVQDNIYVSDPARKTWTLYSNPYETPDLVTVWGKGCGSEIYTNDLRTPSSVQRLARFKGGEWTHYDLPHISRAEALWAADEHTLFIAGDKGTVIRADISQEPPIFHEIASLEDEFRHSESIWGLSENQLFLAGDGGVVFSFDGNEWKREQTGTTSNINDIWASSENNIFIASSEGVFHFDGTSWTSANMPKLFTEFRSVWGVAPNAVFAAGTGGTLAFYDGERWSPVRSPTQHDINSVWASDWPGELFIGNNQGDIYTTTQFAYRGQETNE